jgi:hypothetical protein
VYVKVTVPGAIPVAIPVSDPTVAIDVLLLVQIPPAVVSVIGYVYPRHTLLPEMGVIEPMVFTGTVPIVLVQPVVGLVAVIT